VLKVLAARGVRLRVEPDVARRMPAGVLMRRGAGVMRIRAAARKKK
jgi:hypothetical protein